jgi:hypothetical protein
MALSHRRHDILATLENGLFQVLHAPLRDAVFCALQCVKYVLCTFASENKKGLFSGETAIYQTKCGR